LREVELGTYDLITVDATLAGRLSGKDTVRLLRERGCTVPLASASASEMESKYLTFRWTKPLQVHRVREDWKMHQSRNLRRASVAT